MFAQIKEYTHIYRGYCLFDFCQNIFSNWQWVAKEIWNILCLTNMLKQCLNEYNACQMTLGREQFWVISEDALFSFTGVYLERGDHMLLSLNETVVKCSREMGVGVTPLLDQSKELWVNIEMFQIWNLLSISLRSKFWFFLIKLCGFRQISLLEPSFFNL